MDRRDVILEHVDLAGRGLEIGPLDRPIVSRDRADIRYVDHADTVALREKYRDDPAVRNEAIVAVDYVWDERPLTDIVGAFSPVDFVVASHVIEHVPDLVGWLHQLASVLADGGILSLAIPDKRFVFDVRRTPTDLAEVVEAHLLARRRPSLRAVFDFWARIVTVDVEGLWSGAVDYERSPLEDARALQQAQAATDSDEYTDVHAWVFTPTSFLDLLGRLGGLDLLDYRVAGFRPTQRPDIEFYVALERLARGLDADGRRAARCAAMAALDGATSVGAGSVGAPTRPAPVSMALSPLEARMVGVKREVMGRGRRLVHAVRHRAGGG